MSGTNKLGIIAPKDVVEGFCIRSPLCNPPPVRSSSPLTFIAACKSYYMKVIAVY